VGRRSLAVVAVLLGVGAGCRHSAGITGAPPPSPHDAEREVLLPEARAIAAMQDHGASKVEVTLPETGLRWPRSPCNRRVYHVWSYTEPLLRLDVFINICGDSFLRITDTNGEHWFLGLRPW